MNISYTFKINGTDYSTSVKPYSYTTEYIPVSASRSVTTMDGVEHVKVIRWKGAVHVALKPMTEAQLATLIASFATSAAVQIQYTNLQTNTVITETMKPSKQTAALVLANADHRYVGDIKLDFEAC